MKKEEAKISFALIKIVTEQFAILNEYFKEGNETNLNTKLSFGIDEATKTLLVSALVRFEQNNNPFLVLEISCYFLIKPETWTLFTEENKKTIFPKFFLEHLLVVTIGALRGILHAKTENTAFNTFILPMLAVNKLITGDINFTLSSSNGEQ